MEYCRKIGTFLCKTELTVIAISKLLALIKWLNHLWVLVFVNRSGFFSPEFFTSAIKDMNWNMKWILFANIFRIFSFGLKSLLKSFVRVPSLSRWNRLKMGLAWSEKQSPKVCGWWKMNLCTNSKVDPPPQYNNAKIC